MNVFSLFSGIGAFEKALTRMNIPFDLIGFSEIDKYAVKSYCAIHNVDESKNFGDITKIDETALPKNIDLITYGFPCQDISLAGKQKGLFNEDGTKTRSGLFFEALRIIEATKPRVAIAENVKNLTSKKFAEQFKIVLESLEDAGYNNYYKVLNAKNYGIPQNRERVFIVSIRKDIDNGAFQFPEGFPLELRLKDMLEDEVDEKFYLSKKDERLSCCYHRKNKIEEPQMNQIGQIYGTEREPNPQASRIYDADGISPTLDSCSGGNRMPKIEVVGNYSPSNHDASRIVNSEGLAPTVKENHGTVTAVVEPLNPMPDGTARTIKNQYFKTSKANFERTSTFGATGATNGLRIRKLTPKECFRLMGFDDADFEKAEAVNSNTQLYKQAGNSIVVPVVEHIIKALLDCGALENEREEEKEMELRVNEIALPEAISFNYEELKAELTAKISKYETMVYGEDQIKNAKEDRANLNKLKKALNDERIRREKEYMQPFNVFKAQVNEIISIIDKPIGLIDGQVKEYEESQKKEKLEKCKLIFEAVGKPDWLKFEQIFNQKWLNASVNQKTITTEIETAIETINNNLSALQILPEFSFEAIEVYKTTLDINRALEEGKRLAEIQKKKAEAEAQARETVNAPDGGVYVQDADKQGFTYAEPKEQPKEWIAFKALLSTEDAQALATFFRSRNIEYKAV